MKETLRPFGNPGLESRFPIPHIPEEDEESRGESSASLTKRGFEGEIVLKLVSHIL